MIPVELALWLMGEPCKSAAHNALRETVIYQCAMPEPYGPYIPVWLQKVLERNAVLAREAEAKKAATAKPYTYKSTKKKKQRRRDIAVTSP